MGTLLLKARDRARSEFKANPFPFYARLRREEPVVRISAVFLDAWLVTRYEDAVTVLRDPRISKNISSKMAYIPRFARPLTDHMLGRGGIAIGAPTRMLDVPLALPCVWLLMRYFRKLFAERRAHPGGDLITALVQAEEAGDRLSENELMGTSILLLFAGYETTLNLIASGALALMENPSQQELFVEDPSVRVSAIEELLRFTSPLEITPPSIAREDITIGPVTVRRGDLVSAVLGSANRDESQFRDPDTLDLSRDPNRHLALGQGIHFCLGAPLARMEGQIALTTLFQRFPKLRLAQPAASLRWRKLLPLRGLEALPVQVGAAP